MFDIGWTELLVIGVVALIVVGPRDLPGMFRTLGRFTAKARSMAREFQTAMNQAADEAGVKDVAKDLRDATSTKRMGLNALDDAASKFEKWQPGKSTPKGPETQKLSEERAEQTRKIKAKMQEAGEAKLAREKAEKAAGEASEAAEPSDAPATTETADAKPVKTSDGA